MTDRNEIKPLENGATINSQLKKMAEEDPDKPAFIFWNRYLKRTMLTRQEIWDKSRKCAAFLHSQGISKGDIVCNTLVNSQERLISTYGALLVGASSMNGQKFLADGEDIMKNWKESECKAVICNPKEENGLYAILEKIKYKDEKTGMFKYEGLPYLTVVIYVKCEDDKDGKATWIESLEEQSDMYVDDTVTEEDVAFICTTSGSTGFAKLVAHTHGKILGTAYNFASFITINSESVYYNHRPLGWIGGAPIIYPRVGSTRVFVDYTFGFPESNGELTVHILEHEECDVALLLPSFVQEVLDVLNARGQHALRKKLRCFGTGGGPLSTTTMKPIGRISECIVAIYGATELGFTHHLKVTDQSLYESGCAGLPSKSVEMKILDDKMEEVTNGNNGKIYLRGPTIATEYLNNPELSKDIFLPDGWYCTSDIGQINDKGQLFVFCRTSNAINYKGYKHYPGWMEARVTKHPDIQKCIAVGFPDPVTTEQLCLCIIKKPEATLTVDDVREYWSSLFLTSEKDSITPVPKYCLFFDTFPTNINGKIDRKQTKQLALNRVKDMLIVNGAEV